MPLFILRPSSPGVSPDAGVAYLFSAFRRRLGFKVALPLVCFVQCFFSSLICRSPHFVPHFTVVDIMHSRDPQLLATCFCHLTLLQLPCLQCRKTNYLSFSIRKGASQGILDVSVTSDAHVVISSPPNHTIKGKITSTRFSSLLV